jgi:hypothetical protein
MLNIFQGVNDTFVFSISGQTYTCVIPAGIYNLANLASAINRAYSNLTTPALTLPFPINFLSDDSTQRVVFQFTIAGVQVDFTQPQSIEYEKYFRFLWNQ